MKVVMNFYDEENQDKPTQTFNFEMSVDEIEFFIKKVTVEEVFLEGKNEHPYQYFSSSFVISPNGEMTYEINLLNVMAEE
jgi:hypothetical protein